jgi:hypothetical protein
MKATPNPFKIATSTAVKDSRINGATAVAIFKPTTLLRSIEWYRGEDYCESQEPASYY